MEKQRKHNEKINEIEKLKKTNKPIDKINQMYLVSQ
jgi:hypothetical protein